MSEKRYPEVITPEILAELAHVSDDEIAQDIADTEREISQYRAVGEAEAGIARAHPDQNERRMADFRARARPEQIAQREAFVAYLRRLQVARSQGV